MLVVGPDEGWRLAWPDISSLVLQLIESCSGDVPGKPHFEFRGSNAFASQMKLESRLTEA